MRPIGQAYCPLSFRRCQTFFLKKEKPHCKAVSPVHYADITRTNRGHIYAVFGRLSAISANTPWPALPVVSIGSGNFPPPKRFFPRVFPRNPFPIRSFWVALPFFHIASPPFFARIGRNGIPFSSCIQAKNPRKPTFGIWQRGRKRAITLTMRQTWRRIWRMKSSLLPL